MQQLKEIISTLIPVFHQINNKVLKKSFYLSVNAFNAEHLLGTLSRSTWNLEELVFEESWSKNESQ